MSNENTLSPQRQEFRPHEKYLQAGAKQVADQAIEATFGTRDISVMRAQNMGLQVPELAKHTIQALAGRMEFSGLPEHDATFVYMTINTIINGLPLIAQKPGAEPQKHEADLRNEHWLILQTSIITQWIQRLNGVWTPQAATTTPESVCAAEQAYVELSTMRDHGSPVENLRTAYFLELKHYAEQLVQLLRTENETNNKDHIAGMLGTHISNFTRKLNTKGLFDPENHLRCLQRLQSQMIAELALIENDARHEAREQNRMHVADQRQQLGDLLKKVSGV